MQSRECPTTIFYVSIAHVNVERQMLPMRTGHSDHDGPQKCTYSGRPRRPSASGRAVDCTMALHNALSCYSCHCCGAHDHASCHLRPNRLAFALQFAVPVLDDLVHRLKSLGNETDLCAGVTQDRAVDADAAGFHCHNIDAAASGHTPLP